MQAEILAEEPMRTISQETLTRFAVLALGLLVLLFALWAGDVIANSTLLFLCAPITMVLTGLKTAHADSDKDKAFLLLLGVFISGVQWTLAWTV